MRDLVLVGGGHAHVEVLRSFAMRPPRDVRGVVLARKTGMGALRRPVLVALGLRPDGKKEIIDLSVIAREVMTPYSGMLPGHLAGIYGFDVCHVDLGPLARAARPPASLHPRKLKPGSANPLLPDTNLYHTRALALDLAGGRVECAGRPHVMTPYSGMLPGHLAGIYGFDVCHVDLGPLARAATPGSTTPGHWRSIWQAAGSNAPAGRTFPSIWSRSTSARPQTIRASKGPRAGFSPSSR